MAKSDLPSFADPVGLFALPNAVLLPGGMLPLQIYEDRYLAMVRDALADESIIAMALLRPGYEAYYHTNAAEIYPVVCVGKINDYVEIPGGRYLINLLGLCRARIRQEDRAGEYRMAMLDPMLPTSTGIEIDGEFAARDALRHLLGSEKIDSDAIRRARGMIDSEVALGDLVDRLAGNLLPSDAVEIKQKVLEEMHTVRRAHILITELRVLLQMLEVRQRDLNRWPRLGSMN
jgi:Lon protease-like protein